ncbi:unnamed protein product [Pedinophyceae sp. YPF-701]|nr:unnamed protein product [Pedinophyceae sp. YPF-701]
MILDPTSLNLRLAGLGAASGDATPTFLVHHPRDPVVFAGLQGAVLRFDSLSGALLSKNSIAGLPTGACFTPWSTRGPSPHPMLVIALADWSLLLLDPEAGRVEKIQGPDQRAEKKPLLRPLLSGNPAYPIVLLSLQCHTSVYMQRLYLPPRTDGKEVKPNSRRARAAMQLQRLPKIDAGPILGLEFNPNSPREFLVACLDGSVRAYELSVNVGAGGPMAAGGGIRKQRALFTLSPPSTLSGKQMSALQAQEGGLAAARRALAISGPVGQTGARLVAFLHPTGSTLAWQLPALAPGPDAPPVQPCAEYHAAGRVHLCGVGFLHTAGTTILASVFQAALLDRAWAVMWELQDDGGGGIPVSPARFGVEVGVSAPAVPLHASCAAGPRGLMVLSTAARLRGPGEGEAGRDGNDASLTLALCARVPQELAAGSLAALVGEAASPVSAWVSGERVDVAGGGVFVSGLGVCAYDATKASAGAHAQQWAVLMNLSPSDSQGRFCAPSSVTLSRDAALAAVVVRATLGDARRPGEVVLLQMTREEPQPAAYVDGIAAAFVGPGHARLAVLSGNLATVSLHEVTRGGEVPGTPLSKTSPGDSPILQLLQPDLWAGPSDACRVMWVNSAPALCLSGPLPESADDAGSAGDRLKPEAQLPLLPGERVAQVLWQDINPAGDAHAAPVWAAAVVTSRRVMMVSSTLTVLASANSPAECCGAPLPITSAAWAGPALLAVTASGLVLQLTWTSQLLPVCSVPVDAATTQVAIAGTAPDRVLIARRSAGSPASVSARAVNLAQAVAVGTCTMHVAGVLPGGVPAVRSILRRVAAAWDLGADASPALLAALASASCGDLAHLVAQSADGIGEDERLGAAVMAQDWSSAAAQLLPGLSAAPRRGGGALAAAWSQRRLVDVARGCAATGRLRAAMTCLSRAGMHGGAAAIAAACRSAGAARQVANSMVASGAVPSDDADRMGASLVAAMTLLHGSVPGADGDGGVQVQDMRQTIKYAGDDGAGGEWRLAGPGAAPVAYTRAGWRGQREVTLPAVDVTDLGASLGMQPAGAGGKAGAAGALLGSGLGTLFGLHGEEEEEEEEEDEEEQEGAEGQAGEGEGGSQQPGGTPGDGAQASGLTEAQRRARANFGYADIMASDSDSSDEDDGGAGLASAGGAGQVPTPRGKLMVKIKTLEEMQAEKGSAGRADATDRLRSMVQGLSLNAPARPPPKPAVASFAAPVAAKQQAGDDRADSDLGDLLDDVAGPADAPPDRTAQPPLEPEDPRSAAELLRQGVSEMEEGAWDTAGRSLRLAMSAAMREGSAALATACASYLAAVLLLERAAREAQSGAGAGAGGASRAGEARLKQHAALLKGTKADHRAQLMLDAAEVSLVTGDGRWAAKALGLLANAPRGVPADVVSRAQKLQPRCGAAGSAALCTDGELARFCAAVAGARGPDEVAAIVRKVES